MYDHQADPVCFGAYPKQPPMARAETRLRTRRQVAEAAALLELDTPARFTTYARSCMSGLKLPSLECLSFGPLSLLRSKKNCNSFVAEKAHYYFRRISGPGGDHGSIASSTLAKVHQRQHAQTISRFLNLVYTPRCHYLMLGLQGIIAPLQKEDRKAFRASSDPMHSHHDAQPC